MMNSPEVFMSSPLLNHVQESVITPSLPVIIATKCPWSKVPQVETVSLNDVMSEELAKSLQEADKQEIVTDTVYLDDLNGCGEAVTDCSDDYLLAKMMQLEFDKEHDDILKREVFKRNGTSKVQISYDKYLHCPEENSTSDNDEDQEFFLEHNAKNYWHNFENAERVFQAVGKSGVSRQGNVTTTKHDATVCGRRNAGKMMEFPPMFSTGDGGMFDMKINNNVFNSLKVYSIADHKKRQKVLNDKAEKATTQKALDEKTLLILYKLINNEVFESVSDCISTGKESCVYRAWSGLPEGESPSPEFAIKIFKTTLNEFRNREQYVRGDYRFRNRFSSQNPRKIIHMWAEKEMRNLKRLKAANIPCPEVVTLQKHILVMSFIGKEVPAPKIKDVELPFAEMTLMYEQTLDIMKKMYSECKLVHADLSEYNLLWHEGKVWVIDLSQAVEIFHPNANELLLRDCTNITKFFEQKGVLNIPKPEKLCAEIKLVSKEQNTPAKNSETK